MREPAIKHVQSCISENENAALDQYMLATLTAMSRSGAIRELLAMALTELGWLEPNCNGNITEQVKQQNRNQTKPQGKKHK